jgi:hypothetical protein
LLKYVIYFVSNNPENFITWLPSLLFNHFDAFQEAKEGARSELLILDSAGSPLDSSPSLISNSVGMLDLTETVVQSLVLDIPNITFTVCESRKSAIERQFIVEAMPLAQSTAMDIEYGITAKPEVRLLIPFCSYSSYYGYCICKSDLLLC